MMRMRGTERMFRETRLSLVFWSVMMVLGAGVIVAAGIKTNPAELENLALYRPAGASSVDHFPTLAEFAVDGRADTGWRSVRASDETGDWLTVDLQEVCRIEGVRVTWASRADLPVFEEIRTSALFGAEQVASYGLAYSLLLSTDGKDWKTAYTTTQGTGGTEILHLQPAESRYVRVAIRQRSHPKCGVGINELAVVGTCPLARPEGDSWMLRRKAKVKPVPAIAATEDRVFTLDRGWELIQEDQLHLTASRITDPALDTSAWYNATVPGTVLATLVDQDVFPEPTLGMNNLKIPESLCRQVWWYRTELAIPVQWMQDRQQLWLELDGVNHSAEVWLNAYRLGVIKGAFMRGRFEMTDALNKTGKNILAVRIIPPAHPGIPLEKNEQDWLYNGGALGKDCPTFAASIGWDWMAPIRDRGIGIWSPVRVRRTGAVVIGDPQIITDLPLPDTSRAAVSITVPVRNTTDRPQTIEIKAAFEKVSVSRTISVPAHEVAAAAFAPDSHPELNLKNPRLWWPTGYGEPALYEVTVSAEMNGVLSDTRQMRFGVREFSYRGSKLVPAPMERVDFPPVQARYVRINCLERGTEFGFSLYTVSVFDSRDPAKDLALQASVTASTSESDEHPAAHAADGDPQTRWASKYSQPEWLCVDLGSVQTMDRVGLLWESAYAKRYILEVSTDGNTWTKVKECSSEDRPEDLELSVNGQRILCRGGNWGYPEMLLRLSLDRLEAAVRLHQDANLNMIRNWVGMNTCRLFYDLCDQYGILVWNDFWLANPGDGPDPDDPQLFLENVRDVILQYRNHPSIALWCGRNEGMPPKVLDEGMRELTAALDGTRFYQSHSSDRGVNGGGPYKYMPPEQYFKELNRGFKTEIGMPSVPGAESMRRMLGDEDPWPIDGRWAYHDFCPNGNQYRQEYTKALEEKFGPAAGLDDYCRKAQMINYDGYRAIFEGCNHKIWNDCSGALLWMSHPAWPSTVWQVYDYWFGTDGAFFGSKKANEPIHIQFCPVNDTVEMINHTAGPVEGAVSAAVLGLDAAVLWQKEVNLTAGPNGRTDGFAIEFPADLPPACLIKLKWADKAGKLLSENVYWRGRNNTDLQALDAMPKVKLRPTASFDAGSDHEIAATVTLVNDSAGIALMTQVVLRDRQSGQRILPAYYSDNYLTLLPGESKTITIKCSQMHTGKRMKVSIGGWNVEPAEIQ